MAETLHPLRDGAFVAAAGFVPGLHAGLVFREPVLARLEFSFELVDPDREADDGLEQSLAQAAVKLVELWLIGRFGVLHQRSQQRQFGGKRLTSNVLTNCAS